MNEEFWKRCMDAGCVVIPLRIYSEWTDGEAHESKREGTGFLALEYDQDVVGPEYYFQIDHSLTEKPIHTTPEAALEDFCKKNCDLS